MFLGTVCDDRENIIKPLDTMFPGLVSKNLKILMAGDLYRPDVSTTDCMPRATQMEKKSDGTLMEVETEEDLNAWMHVCWAHSAYLSLF